MGESASIRPMTHMTHDQSTHCLLCCPVDRRQQRRRRRLQQILVDSCRRRCSAANAGSVMLRVDGGGWTQISFYSGTQCKCCMPIWQFHIPGHPPAVEWRTQMVQVVWRKAASPTRRTIDSVAKWRQCALDTCLIRGFLGSYGFPVCRAHTETNT